MILTSLSGIWKIRSPRLAGQRVRCNIIPSLPLQTTLTTLWVVEFWGGKIAYFYCSWTQAHGHDVSTEVTGTEGKVSVDLVPRANNVVVCDRRGIDHEVQEEYWQRFEHAFATEAQELVNSILKDTPVPLPLKTGIKVMQIARGLQSALWSGEVTKWDEKGELLTDGANKMNGYVNGHVN